MSMCREISFAVFKLLFENPRFLRDFGNFLLEAFLIGASLHLYFQLGCQIDLGQDISEATARV